MPASVGGLRPGVFYSGDTHTLFVYFRCVNPPSFNTVPWLVQFPLTPDTGGFFHLSGLIPDSRSHPGLLEPNPVFGISVNGIPYAPHFSVLSCLHCCSHSLCMVLLSGKPHGPYLILMVFRNQQLILPCSKYLLPGSLTHLWVCHMDARLYMVPVMESQFLPFSRLCNLPHIFTGIQDVVPG